MGGGQKRASSIVQRLFYITYLSFQTKFKMRLIVKTLLILGLAATSIEMTNATIRTCSSARNFLQFVQCKIRRVCLEVSELKHTVNECCSKNGKVNDVLIYTHFRHFTV